jgi:3-oxoacyl-[acyl-carrier-protein] synthase-3
MTDTSAIGRIVHTHSARIAGVVSCVPGRCIDNAYFNDRFTASAVADVARMIGVENRRWAAAEQSTADLCCAAGRKLLSSLGWRPESVDALIFVSQTPDYQLPATACSLHARFGLKPATIAFDVNLGCSGYPYALWLAMTLIAGQAAGRVLVAVGDTISRVVDPADRATAMLFGDAGTVTALEFTAQHPQLHEATFVLGTDGSGVPSLIIPPGPTAHLHMDGAEIFNFTLRTIPALVADTLKAAGKPADSYAAYLFHQANLFILSHLTKKMKLPPDRVPINIADDHGVAGTVAAIGPADRDVRVRRGLFVVIGVSLGGAARGRGAHRVMSVFATDCLQGRTFLVTGGSSGIGRSVCALIADCGGIVIASGRNAGQLQRTLTSLTGNGHAGSAHEFIDADATAGWVRDLAAQHGALSGIFHGAGVELLRPVRLTKQEHLAGVFGAAVYGTFGIARAAAQKDVLTDHASLVLMSSVAGSRGQAGMSAYCAAKSAIDGLTRTLSCEFAARKIRVNSLVAGAVATGMHDRLTNASPPESVAAYQAKHLLGFGTARDIASAVVFLLSDASRWITGTNMVVDGGYMVR